MHKSQQTPSLLFLLLLLNSVWWSAWLHRLLMRNNHKEAKVCTYVLKYKDRKSKTEARLFYCIAPVLSIHPFIHPSISFRLSSTGSQQSSLSGATQASLSLGSSSSSFGRSPRGSQASRVTASPATGHSWNSSPGGHPLQMPEPPLLGSSGCGRAAFLVWAPPRWQISSHYL